MKDWDYKEVLKYVYYEVRSELKKKEQTLCTELHNSRAWGIEEGDEAYLGGLLHGAEEARKLFEDAMERIAIEFYLEEE